MRQPSLTCFLQEVTVGEVIQFLPWKQKPEIPAAPPCCVKGCNQEAAVAIEMVDFDNQRTVYKHFCEYHAGQAMRS